MDSNTINVLCLDRLTILFFYAEAYSLQEIKGVEKQVKEFLPSIDFLKINVRSNPKVSSSFHVYTTPLVLILQNGKEIWRQPDAFSENELCSYLSLMSAHK